jgi:hypothetical protein
MEPMRSGPWKPKWAEAADPGWAACFLLFAMARLGGTICGEKVLDFPIDVTCKPGLSAGFFGITQQLAVVVV